MKETIIISVFFVWYIFSLVISELIGKKRIIGVEWSFFLCMALSPVIGFFSVYFWKTYRK